MTQTTFERIYEQAMQLIVRDGVHFSFQELEKRAGVGSGSLRHHFKNKAKLIAVFAEDEYYYREGRPAELAQADDAGLALEEWALELSEWFSHTFGRSEEMLKAVRDPGRALHPLLTKILTATTPLLERANSSAQLRLIPTAEEFLVSLIAAAVAADLLISGPASVFLAKRTETTKCYVHLFLAGIRRDKAQDA